MSNLKTILLLLMKYTHVASRKIQPDTESIIVTEGFVIGISEKQQILVFNDIYLVSFKSFPVSLPLSREHIYNV